MSTVAFLIVMFPFLSIMEESGSLDRLGQALSKFAKGPRSVETITVASMGILSMVTGVISVAMLSVGEIIKNLGEKFNVDGYRRANLMDCAGVTFCFIVPWTVHAIIPSMLATNNSPEGLGLQVSPLSVPMHNFYSWTMLVMLIFAIITGYGRTWFKGKAVLNLEKNKP